MALVRPVRPDQEHGTDGEQLPEDEERDQITRKRGAHRAACIDQAGDMLQRVFKVQRIDDEDESGDMEDIAEDQAQLVGAHQYQLVLEDWQAVNDIRRYIEP